MGDDGTTEPKTPRRGTRLRKSTLKAQEHEDLRKQFAMTKLSDEEENEDDFSGEEVQIHDTVLTGTPLAGKEIYGFNKKKKHERIITTQESPPKSASKATIPKTPFVLRKKLKKGIKKSVKFDSSSDEDAFADSGSEYSASGNSSTSSSSEAEDDAELEKSDDSSDEDDRRLRKPSALPKTPRTMQRRAAARNHKYIINTEDYFTNNAMKKPVTSNHTLDKLQTPRLSQEQLRKLLSKTKFPKNHQAAALGFAESARNGFDKWICLLHENFNVLVYGLGSKKNLLGDFQAEMLAGLPVIVVNGFFPSLTLKDILDAILLDVLEVKENPANPFDACEVIERQFEAMHDQHLYIIVHNIEGDMLRNGKSQSVLARLANVPNIHLVASIDHINAPLIWDHSKLSKFKFVWWDVTSFLPYVDETSFESSMMVQRTGTLALSSLRNVFLSLTSNSKGIYMIILKYQLANTSQYYQGMLFKDLYWSCREAFLVSSDLALRAQLTEFVDHKMVKIKRSADGAEYLIIPIANNLLQQFMNEQNS